MATELRWRNGIVGNWFTADNWDPGTVPTTGDTAIIESGTATISSPSDPLTGIAIVLGGADGGLPPILEAIHTVFEGTSSTPEVNTTLTVTGLPNAPTDAVFIIEGDTSFDGQIFVEAIAGSLTILIQSDGSDPSTFKLLNTDDRAAIVVSQESFLDFEGQTVFNESLIQIEGTVEISTGVSFVGNDDTLADQGAFLLENGGQLLVEGSVGVSQHIVFIDGTGKLTIENLADFHGVIEYAELPAPKGQPAQGIAGGQIDLTEVQAQSLDFDASTNTLNLYAGTTPTGTPIAQLSMRMVSDSLESVTSTLSSADFTLSSDGNGGTLVTYAPQGATYLQSSLPTPVIAQAGEVVSLKTMLKDAFGTADTPFKGVWLYPSQPFENTSTNVGYWDSPNVTPQWFIGGKPVEAPTFVKDISKVTLLVGNQIDNPASFQLRVTDDKSGPEAEWINYDVWTVDPRVIEAMQVAGYVPGTAPTYDTVVKAAQAFATVFGDGVIPNTNLCNWIADNVAAAAGAPMPLPNASFDPSLNTEGGFWRIVYASDIPDPVQDWSTLTQPGDIVRMGWFHPESGRVSGHSTTVLSDVTNGEIEFYDNVDDKHIGIHNAAYWLYSDPDDITIYQIDPNQQYLIQGTSLAETIRGSVHNNLIRPGGGADIITAGIGDNEIEGTAAQLNGIKVTDFNLGDSFDFTDLDPESASVSFKNGKLTVFEDLEQVAVIKVPKPAHGLSFAVTTDGDGGTLIELVSDQLANRMADATKVKQLVQDDASTGRAEAKMLFDLDGHSHVHDFDLM